MFHTLDRFLGHLNSLHPNSLASRKDRELGKFTLFFLGPFGVAAFVLLAANNLPKTLIEL
jgi:hypothetical protein